MWKCTNAYSLLHYRMRRNHGLLSGGIPYSLDELHHLARRGSEYRTSTTGGKLAMPEELRPTEILELFWNEQIVIEEDADFLEPVYFEEQEAA